MDSAIGTSRFLRTAAAALALGFLAGAAVFLPMVLVSQLIVASMVAIATVSMTLTGHRETYGVALLTVVWAGITAGYAAAGLLL